MASLDEARYLDANEEYERIYGYRRDELVGRSAFDLGLWADLKERDYVRSLLRRGEPSRTGKGKAARRTESFERFATACSS